jgi:hypothetical protein
MLDGPFIPMPAAERRALELKTERFQKIAVEIRLRGDTTAAGIKTREEALTRIAEIDAELAG